MEQRTEEIGRGAAAGIGATTAMSAVLIAAQHAGLLGRLPPERITERMLDALHLSRNRREQKALAAISHYGYGTVTGAVFGLLQRRIAPRHPVAAGVAFGGLVWLSSYVGWVPALKILPPPRKDRPGRQLTLVLAHAVYGAVLGLLSRRAR